MGMRRFLGIRANLSIIRPILSVAAVVMLTVQAQAGQLTTFEDYAAMMPEQQSSVRARATSVIYRDALTRNDVVQVQCLRYTYSTKYGSENDVQMAHARLRGWLEAGVEHHDEQSRVEYAVLSHVEDVCPPSNLAVSH